MWFCTKYKKNYKCKVDYREAVTAGTIPPLVTCALIWDWF